jgi:hypothetical protein
LKQASADLSTSLTDFSEQSSAAVSSIKMIMQGYELPSVLLELQLGSKKGDNMVMHIAKALRERFLCH